MAKKKWVSKKKDKDEAPAEEKKVAPSAADKRKKIYDNPRSLKNMEA